MAQGYVQNAIYGAPLDGYVREQLAVREELVKKSSGAYRSPEELSYLNGKTAFVKLSSSVNVQGLADVANRNVLFGGTLSNGNQRGGIDRDSLADSQNPNPAYTTYESVGMRPMPGINSVHINTKNTYGTLRVASIEFSAWSLEQLTELEKIYLRPGYTALLEWGNTVYFKSGLTDFVSSPDLIPGFVTNKTDYTKEKLFELIETRRIGSKGNYDAMYGFITNFRWSYRIDGGYDCACELTSIGALTESMKVVLSKGQTENYTDAEKNGEENKDPDKKKSGYHAYLKGILDYTPSSIFNYNSFSEGAHNSGANASGDLGDRIFQQLNLQDSNAKPRILDLEVSHLEDSKEASSLRYVTLRDLLAYFNTIAVSTKKEKIVRFNLNRSIGKFRSIRDHIGLDPGICVIPKPFRDVTGPLPVQEKNIPISYKVGGAAYDLVSKDNENSPNRILDIFINVKYLLNKLDYSLANIQDIQANSIFNFLESILNDLEDNLGGINSFDIVQRNGTHYIVDRELTPNRGDLKESKINVTGLRSLVTNLSLTSKIPSALTTMIATTAQFGASDLNVEGNHMLRWNEGLTDRILPEKFVTNGVDQALKFEQDRNALASVIYQFNIDKPNYNPDKFLSVKSAHRFFTQTIANSLDGKTGAAGIIPLELDLTMDGIGGIKISQGFTINKGILPEQYDDKTGFLVTGLEHSIQNNRWETSIKGQIIVLESKVKTQGNVET